MKKALLILLLITSISCESIEEELFVFERTYTEQLIEINGGERVYGKLIDLKPYTRFKPTNSPDGTQILIENFEELERITNSELYFNISEEFNGTWSNDSFIVEFLGYQNSSLVVVIKSTFITPIAVNEFDRFDLWIEYTKED